jgi:hypothetical protein
MEHLFAKYELRGSIEAHEQRALAEVKGAPENHVLQVDVDAWADALAEKWSLAAPRLDLEGLYQDQPQPCEVDVSFDQMRYFGSAPPFVAGHRTTVHLPFAGDRDLFRMQASTYTMGGTPQATIGHGHLDLDIEYPDDRPADVAAEARRWADAIQQQLNWIEADLDGFEARLRSVVRNAITARQASIAQHRDHVARTALPMKPKGDKDKTYVAEAIERRPPPPAPVMSLERPLPLEPVLSEAIYDDIIKTLRSTAVGMERSAKTYVEMGEEDLRHVVLLPLADRYHGQATAETFNSEGKADVVLRWDGKNIFVGEMKIWSGETEFLRAIDQLFGYATWRDVGLALIVFVKQKGVASVIETAQSALEDQDYFIEINSEIDGGFRATIKHPREADISARLSVLFVHLDG